MLFALNEAEISLLHMTSLMRVGMLLWSRHYLKSDLVMKYLVRRMLIGIKLKK